MENPFETIIAQNKAILAELASLKEREKEKDTWKAQEVKETADTQGIIADKAYKTDEVKKIVDVSNSTLWKWQNEGKFPRPFISCGNLNLWRGSDLIQWLRG